MSKNPFASALSQLEDKPRAQTPTHSSRARRVHQNLHRNSHRHQVMRLLAEAAKKSPRETQKKNLRKEMV